MLPKPTPSHCLSSIRLPKCIRSERLEEELQNDILVFINIKQVFFDSLIKSTVYLLIFRQNSMIYEGSPNSLTESYFNGELRLGSPNSLVN